MNLSLQSIDNHLSLGSQANEGYLPGAETKARLLLGQGHISSYTIPVGYGLKGHVSPQNRETQDSAKLHNVTSVSPRLALYRFFKSEHTWGWGPNFWELPHFTLGDATLPRSCRYSSPRFLPCGTLTASTPACAAPAPSSSRRFLHNLHELVLGSTTRWVHDKIHLPSRGLRSAGRRGTSRK